MPPTCSICKHPDLRKINRELLAPDGPSLRNIASRYGTTATSLLRHRREHLAPEVATALRRRERDAGTLVSRIERLISEAEEILIRNKAAIVSEDAQPRQDRAADEIMLRAIREIREALKLLGTATGELDERPTVQILNVQTDPGWIAARQALMRALAPFPEARSAVVAAFRQLPGWIEPHGPRGTAPVALAPYRPPEDEDPFDG